MYKVELVDHWEDDFPRSCIIIHCVPERWAEFPDHGEPEDNSFHRDYKWVLPELLFAYKQGRDDEWHDLVHLISPLLNDLKQRALPSKSDLDELESQLIKMGGSHG